MRTNALFRLALAAIALTAGSATTYGQTVGTLSAPAPAQNSASSETVFGDLAADAVRSAAGTDLAFVPAASLSASGLPAGSVSAAQAAAAFTYPRDPVMVVRLTERQIDAALERSWSIYPLKHQGLLQVSGLTYAVDRARPSGRRVSGVRAAGTAVSATQTYTVGMPDSLANGGLGYFKVWDKSAVASSTKVSLLEATTRYLSAHSPLSPPPATRAHVLH